MAKDTTLFGINLRNAVRRSGLTFQEAANRIGITRGFLYMLMGGDKEPSPETLANICTTLNVSRADLYEEELRERTVGELSPDELVALIKNEQLSQDESELLGLFREAKDDSARRIILDTARRLRDAANVSRKKSSGS